MSRPRIGLALGGGAARGWAHMGVIHALEESGIHPDVVAGTSVGALVGGIYAAGRLKVFEDWVRGLDRIEVARYLDVRLLARGGLIEGERLISFFRQSMGDPRLDELRLPFGAVATNLGTGHEVWLREGPLWEALRASFALPGLFTPVRSGEQWLVDGGLVNPVPVSLCRALGAEIVIAVNLNGDIVGRHLRRESSPDLVSRGVESTLLERFTGELRDRANHWVREIGIEPDRPGMFEVVASAINVMQDRITRSRMAGDPPELLLSPRLSHIALMEFDRADEAIAVGRHCVERNRMAIEELRRYLG